MEIAGIEIGGRQRGICPMPGRTGDYASDLATLLAWSPRLVVTLAEMGELAAAQLVALDHAAVLADAKALARLAASSHLEGIGVDALGAEVDLAETGAVQELEAERGAVFPAGEPGGGDVFRSMERHEDPVELSLVPLIPVPDRRLFFAVDRDDKPGYQIVVLLRDSAFSFVLFAYLKFGRIVRVPLQQRC